VFGEEDYSATPVFKLVGHAVKQDATLGQLTLCAYQTIIDILTEINLETANRVINVYQTDRYFDTYVTAICPEISDDNGTTSLTDRKTSAYRISAACVCRGSSITDIGAGIGILIAGIIATGISIITGITQPNT
jgi:2-polyprenyl-3-methyl-5-hydroxy-6-metoxy-1,4-benzoquinol methylase